MAEARMAVEPTPALQRVGFEVDTSKRTTQLSVTDAGIVVYIPHPYFLWRSGKRSFWRTWHKVQVAYMPVPISVVAALSAAVALWVAQSPGDSWQRSGKLADMLWKIDSLLPWASKIPTQYRVAYLAAYCTGAISFAVTAAQRFLLRRLLSYHGWIYERATKSVATKCWGFILKNIFFRRIRCMLDAYASALPTLPLPSIEATVAKYMTTIEPLLEDNPEELQRIRGLASDFLNNEGPRLQRKLRMKWLISDNYISDWWLNYVYLQSRSSLCINSNWYGVLYAEYLPTTVQSARAASTIYNLLKLRKQLDTGTFEPQILGGFVPLCMAQYDYVFSVTRIPGREQDTLKKYDNRESKHLAVIHRGKFYRMNVYDPATNKILTPLQMQLAIDGIINAVDDTPSSSIESLIPALTAAERSNWADIRETHFLLHEYNRIGLDIFESAIFVLCLDDIIPENLSTECINYLCGNGSNRWSDKSFNLVVTKNAKMGLHAEHSWGDAPTLAHILEWVSTSDEVKELYDSNGNIRHFEEDRLHKEKGTFRIFPAERIRFTVDETLKAHLQSIHDKYVTDISDVDLRVARFNKYGKEVCKAAKCSPDGWLQMAMQLAYYRRQGHFDQTYESSMTRLFKAGRTETIRTVSHQSCDFVRSMSDTKCNRSERLEKLRKACEQHQKYSHDAMTGHGVDRHLFGLVVVSYGTKDPSPFLRSVFERKWKLSTSQVLTKQVPSNFHPKDTDQFHTPNGGFGPVADDGYGVSYCVFGETMFYFNVTSKKSCSTTDSSEFLEQIFLALEDLGNLVDKKQEVTALKK
jgi:carnitine O-palmitoyltransferase 1, liver isoform